jgi:zinc protease
MPTDDATSVGAGATGGFAARAYYTPGDADLGLDESMPDVRETRLPNGFRVVTLEPNASAGSGSLALRVRLPGGSALDDTQRGVANFTAAMLTRGSAGRTLDELAEELDGLGASIGAGAGREITDVTAKA